MDTINKAMAMSADAPKITVTTSKLAVGVNFYKLCFVLMLRQPETLAELNQNFGRANRIDTTGPVHVALPISPGETLDPTELYNLLRRKFLHGK